MRASLSAGHALARRDGGVNDQGQTTWVQISKVRASWAPSGGAREAGGRKGHTVSRWVRDHEARSTDRRPGGEEERQGRGPDWVDMKGGFDLAYGQVAERPELKSRM